MVIVGLDPEDREPVRTRTQAHADSEDEANGAMIPVRPASAPPEQMDQWAAGQDGEVRVAVRRRRSRVEASTKRGVRV